MHKDGKWARQLIALQQSDGKWGYFHSLSQFSDSPVTTEQALRRLERLGYTIEDTCIQKAVSYMNNCLTGKDRIPDRAEKLHDWNIFTSLLLATWIRRFTYDNPAANKIAGQWAEVISGAFSDGTYDCQKYAAAYRDIFGIKPNGGRLLDFVNFYPISLVRDCLDEKIECAVMDYVIQKEDGIYYIYDNRLSILPQDFESRNASRYLGAVELLSQYQYTRRQLAFVADWLNANRQKNGRWYMGGTVNDKIYFPLSDDWRRKETREADCTERIAKLLLELTR